MSKDHEPQHDIARTLRGLLPVQGASKALREIRDQLRLLNEIRDPSDERLSRIIVRYFRDPRYSHDTRFLKIDESLNDEDLSARWTRVRIGPAVSTPAIGAGGNPPNQKLIAKKLPAISDACACSPQKSFYIWDLLKEYFGVTRDNNRYYHQWLVALSDALKRDPRFVIIAADEKTSIPVEWTLAVDREQQVNDEVTDRLSEVIALMEQSEDLFHLTRDLVHRFFILGIADETYDIHAYYKALSKALELSPSVFRVFVQEEARQAEAWCLKVRIQQAILSRFDSILDWLHALGTPQPLEAILRQFLRLPPELASAEALAGEASQALSADLRFLCDLDHGWRAVPPGPPENLPAYHILWTCRSPLTRDAIADLIRERFPSSYSNLDLLADDSRFLSWRGDRWGLSAWLDINDLAYEYLCEKQVALRSDTIVNKVCEQHNISMDYAVFTPEDDPRFVSHPHHRWYYRYAITDAELDQMLARLCSSSTGLTLDEIVAQTIGLDAPNTDAHQRLSQDERFVLTTGRWFSREQVFHHLTDDEMDWLLAVLYEIGTGLRWTTLVQRALECEACLTDAETKLRADPRFGEILPGVWMAADLQLPSESRSPVFSRPIRSEAISVIPDDEYTEAEELTPRESRPSGEIAHIHRKQITRTLSLLDVRHGNLVIDRAVAGLLSSHEVLAIHFTDEMRNEFTGWIDRADNLLQGLGDWFRTRKLTFGDKIVIRSTEQVGFFEIESKGQRDERVYGEALQRQDIESLIEGARQTRKSYHDLIIEVMDYFGQVAGEPVPLHREDIYNLVNYNRTASRSHIFSLLSLADCPYEELRYFVPHGRGYWSFDPERRKAFEMKMKELVERVEQLETDNNSLQQQVVSTKAESITDMTQLRQRVQEQEALIAALSAEKEKLVEANQHFNEAKDNQLRQISERDGQISALTAQVVKQTAELETVCSDQERLQEELTDVRKERDQLRDTYERQTREIENLARSKAALESEVADLRVQWEQQSSQSSTLHEDVRRFQADLGALASEKATQQQHYEQIVNALRSQVHEQQQKYEELARRSESQQREFERELDSERGRAQQLDRALKVLERSRDVKVDEFLQLRTKFDLTRSVLRTPLGRGFLLLSRFLGGPDLRSVIGDNSNE